MLYTFSLHTDIKYCTSLTFIMQLELEWLVNLFYLMRYLLGVGQLILSIDPIRVWTNSLFSIYWQIKTDSIDINSIIALYILIDVN